MTAMDRHIRIELTIPGDDGHVSHRVREAVASLTRIGFRLALRLDGGTVFIMQDHEEPVDSSTVDDPGHPDRFSTDDVGTPLLAADVDGDPYDRPVMLPDVCGMAVCGHDKANHDLGHIPAQAGMMAARPGGMACRADVAPGVQCNCPGFTPVTGNLLSGPKPLPY